MKNRQNQYQQLTYKDLCVLSQCFRASANLSIPSHYRINEALKEALGRAQELHPFEAVCLARGVRRRETTVPNKPKSIMDWIKEKQGDA